MINSIFFRNLSMVSYYGNNKTLKHVWAVGRCSEFACFCITKLRDFNPAKGTLSLPVQNIKNAFLLG
jgi:hypothetical protein